MSSADTSDGAFKLLLDERSFEAKRSRRSEVSDEPTERNLPPEPSAKLTAVDD